MEKVKIRIVEFLYRLIKRILPARNVGLTILYLNRSYLDSKWEIGQEFKDNKSTVWYRINRKSAFDITIHTKEEI